MSRLRSQMPSLSSLLEFEAAARHLSFTRAGQELNITQAAISHQIRVLERDLNAKLFDRSHGGLRLTKVGQRLHETVSASFGAIAEVVAEVRQLRATNVVSICVTQTFCAFWIAPSLSAFRDREPKISLRLLIYEPHLGLELPDADVTVRYGDGNWPAWRVRSLSPDTISVVCGPAYLSGRSLPTHAQDLLNEVLLHWDSDEQKWPSWQTFLRHHGAASASIHIPGPRFTNYLATIDAARSGLGIALGSSGLCRDALSRGELVQPLPLVMPTSNSFHLLTSLHGPLTSAVSTFCEWLLNEARPYAAPEQLTPGQRARGN